MAGRGFLKEAAPIRNSSIKMLRNGRWQMMAEPINYDRPFAGAGLAASFAQVWCEHYPGQEIGLIPCADGGSSMDEWMPGTPLFDHAVLQAKLAQRTSEIVGILWHQGESDCADDRLATYSDKLDRMIKALRKQLGLENVPFVIGGLGEYLPECTLHDYFKNAPLMDKQLYNFAQRHENCYYVTAKNLQPNPDILHFSAQALRIFGVRYFTACDERRHVLLPLANEQEILAKQQNYVEMPVEDKIRMLKDQLNTGVITWQTYDIAVAELISAM